MEVGMKVLGMVAVMGLVAGGALGQGLKVITVGPMGSKADFATLQEAVTAAPETGGVIRNCAGDLSGGGACG